MIFELVGSRLIAPYVGTSIYVWTSLIGVILASLSLGYYFGGRLADKNANRKFLGTVIAISALLICSTVFVKDVGILLLGDQIPVPIKSLILSFFLFAPSSFFLGIVSPYAVKLKANSLQTIGENVGDLYAISTAGSILGTFLAGFYIIPNFGTKTAIFLISGSLIFVSFLLIGKNLLKSSFIAYLIVIILLLIIFGYFFDKQLPYWMIADIDTKYNKIWILKSTDKKTEKPIIVFSTDPFGSQAAVFEDGSDDLVFNYTKFFRLSHYFTPFAKDALMLGGCVLTYPRDFIKNFPEAKMDVVEIDPASTQIAKDYFHFQDSEQINIINEDARVFLNKNQKKYDVIFGDVFNSASSVPFHLATKEAVQKQYEALNENGAVLMNIISSISGKQGKFLRAEYATYKEIFGQVFLFLVNDKDNQAKSQNIMLVAIKSKSPFSFKKADSEEINEYLNHLWSNPVELDLPVLTDDFAPVEYYSDI